MPRKHIIGIFISIVMIGTLSLWTLGNNRNPSERYLTAKVERASISNRVSATGTLEAVQTVQVGSQTSGQIAALYADFNAVVKKGQLLAILDPRQAQSQVETAQAHLAAAEAQLRSAEADLLNQKASVAEAEANVRAAEVAREMAKLTYDRTQGLDSHGLVSKSDRDAAKTSFDSADAKLQQARAALEQAKTTFQARQAAIDLAKANVTAAKADLDHAQVGLDLTKIYSPVDGVVISRNVDVGQTVAASLGAVHNCK